jgi:zinc transport system ATP-binding protein
MSNKIITVRNVSKHALGRAILHDVSFTLNQAELATIIGPNGAGKSTLVKILLGLQRADSVSVHIASTARIHYIPQIVVDDAHALPLSVAEYLKIGTTPLYCPVAGPFDFAGALRHVGVAPEVLTQTWQSLSGGERQRVAIARALLSQPTVLVLDEPLAAVDYHSRDGLYELIRHLQQVHQMTVLLVSHDVDSVLPISDRVLCLNHTLHTDCHPTAYQANLKQAAPRVHHHC